MHGFKQVCDTLGTFDAIAEIPEDSLSAYVISMTKTASDVLAVRLLQKEAGVEKPMRVRKPYCAHQNCRYTSVMHGCQITDGM